MDMKSLLFISSEIKYFSLCAQVVPHSKYVKNIFFYDMLSFELNDVMQTCR